MNNWIQQLAQQYEGRLLEQHDGSWILEIRDLKLKTPILVEISEDRKLRYWLPHYLQFSGYSGIYHRYALETLKQFKSSLDRIKQLSQQGYVEVKTTEQKLIQAGYKMVKTGEQKIYQKSVGGGFLKALVEPQRILLALTPGSYSDPDEILNQEKRLLES